MKKIILLVFLVAMCSLGYSQSIQKWIMIHDSIVDQSGANYISFDANGIGVNTPSPTEAFDVAGNALISDTLKVAGDNYIADDELWLGGVKMISQFSNSILIGNVNSWGMYVTSNFTNVYTNNTKRFEVGKGYSWFTNNLGVGTATPLERFVVADGNAVIEDTLKVDTISPPSGTLLVDGEINIGDRLRMQGDSRISEVSGKPLYGDQSATLHYFGDYLDTYIRMQSTDEMRFYSGGTERFRVDDNMIWTAVDVGINTTSPNTTLDVNGGQTWKVTTVNTATYDLLITDHILHVTYTSTGAVTSLTLPSAQTTDGRMVIIKDAGGNASTNNITIDTEGSETIDGSATLVINGDYDCAEIYSDGTNWFVKNIY